MLVVNVNALYWSKEGKESHTKSLRASILYVLKTTFLLIALKTCKPRKHIQGVSEKCTGAFKFGCGVIFWSIYLSKSGLISLFIYRIHTKKFHITFNFIANINICKYMLKILKKNFVSIILNAHNDPCFEDKSSSLNLKYRPIHFFE